MHNNTAKPAAKSRTRASFKEISLMLVFQLLQNTTSRLASFMAYQLWFHPGRKYIKSFPLFNPEGTQARQFKLNGKTVYYWCAGQGPSQGHSQGPSVLLVHGWGSCGNQMAPIGLALLSQGYRVIWFDAPAHGQSSGWQTSLFEVSQCIREIQQQEGRFDTLLTHSFGSLCGLHAMQQGLQVSRFIAIAPPSTVSGLIDHFCKILRVKQKIQNRVIQRIEKFIGPLQLSDIDAISMAHDIHQPGLIIHDKQDRMIRIANGRLLHKHLKGSTLVETQKLGHNKILNASQTITLCVNFIQTGQSDEHTMTNAG